MESNETGNFVYTDADLTTLGQVGATNLQIKGSTTVAGSVYGGGESSDAIALLLMSLVAWFTKMFTEVVLWPMWMEIQK